MGPSWWGSLLRLVTIGEDRFFARELIAGAVMVSAVGSAAGGGPTLLQTVASEFPLGLTALAAVSSASLAGTIEDGRFGFVWTSPVPRPISLFVRLFGQTVANWGVVLVALIALTIICFPSSSITVVLQLAVILLSTLLLYLGLGFVAAVCLRSSIPTLVIVLVGLAIGPSYVMGTISDPDVVYFLTGPGSLSSLGNVAGSLFVSPFQVAAGLLLVLASYCIVSAIDLRSGR